MFRNILDNLGLGIKSKNQLLGGDFNYLGYYKFVSEYACNFHHKFLISFDMIYNFSHWNYRLINKEFFFEF